HVHSPPRRCSASNRNVYVNRLRHTAMTILHRGDVLPLYRNVYATRLRYTAMTILHRGDIRPLYRNVYVNRLRHTAMIILHREGILHPIAMYTSIDCDIQPWPFRSRRITF